MERFLKYFEDQNFVDWVLNPNEELNQYWAEYLKNNPEEKREIELAQTLIGQLKSKKETVSQNESLNLFTQIISNLSKEEKSKRTRRITLSLLKYAAVALVFFALGISYLLVQKTGPLDEISKQIVIADNLESSHLVLGGGDKVIIPEKESKIEYSKNGNIIVNQRDTVQQQKNDKAVLNQLVVPFGKNSSITLPDGTTAFINAGSRLVYPSFFEGRKREVYLFGEGYFKVRHNAEKPFIVNAGELAVEVLGTSFNLSAYTNEKIIETVLVEGKVKIRKAGINLFAHSYVLEPNQRAAYNREIDDIKISKVDVGNYISWHEGYLNFESEDLNRIVKKVERYYNVRIKLDDPILGTRKITGKLKLNEDIAGVLNVLSKSASVKFIKLNESSYVIK